MKKNILLMAALLIASATVFNACSSDDNITSENQQPASTTGKYTMTVQASKGDGATTRALSLSGSTLNATWKTGEKVVVWSSDGTTTKYGELEAQSDGANTTLKGTLTTKPADGASLLLKFLSPNYTSQSGTIDYIAANCDYATASVTAKVVGDDVSTTADANFENQQSIVKFTLKDKGNSDADINATKLVVSDGTTDYTVTPTPATSELYVALPDISSKTLTLTATDGTYHYAYEKSGVTFANGQYYEITVKMSKTAPVAAAAVDLGLSVKWANMNVGAESVTDRGLYFAWGETTGHAFGSGYKFSLDNYAWYNSTDLYTKYKHDGSSWDYEELASEDDAAAKIWGGVWRMPTKAEWEELLNEDNCTWTWTTDYKEDGLNVAGVIVTSKKVGYTDKSIFLPATGSYSGDNNTGSEIYANYWSKSLYTDNTGTDHAPNYKYDCAWKLEILYNEGSFYYKRVQNENRYCGIGVRAVRE